MKREQRWSEHQHQEKLFEEDVFVISCYGRKNRGSGLVVMGSNASQGTVLTILTFISVKMYCCLKRSIMGKCGSFFKTFYEITT